MLSVLHTVHVHFKEVKPVWTKMTRQSLFLNLSYIIFDNNCVSTKAYTQLNTEFATDDNTEQFKLHTTDTHKRKRIIMRLKFYKKDSSIDMLTQYTILLITSCFFVWLRFFLTFAVRTTSSSHSFVFWNRYPSSLPVRFKLLNLAVFCWFPSFCSDSAATNQCLFAFLPKSSPL